MQTFVILYHYFQGEDKKISGIFQEKFTSYYSGSVQAGSQYMSPGSEVGTNLLMLVL